MRAAAAVVANPEMSDHAIAAEIGVSQMTVTRARHKSTETNVSVEKRTGRDGRKRRSRKKKAKVKKVTQSYGPGNPARLNRAREIVRPLVLAGKPINAKKLSGQHDNLSHDIFEKAAIAEKATLAALKIDFASLPDKDRFDAALSRERERLEAEFDARVDKELRVKFRSLLLGDARSSAESPDDPLLVRWENSLGGLAGYAIAMEAYWDHEFGDGWRSCPVSNTVVTLSGQAAEAWQKVNELLKQRRRP